jgi:hypothetical protein
VAYAVSECERSISYAGKAMGIKIEKLLEQYRNVPFVHNGRTLDGLDCLGFVVHFYKNFGIYLPDSDGKEIDKTGIKPIHRDIYEAYAS